MTSTRGRKRYLAPVVALALGLLAASAAWADSVAVTAGVTSVTASSARLNGVVQTAYTDNSWLFQYGPAAGDYTHQTPAGTAGAGTTLESRTVTGLTPDTTYHYRIVVLEGSYAPQGHYGEDLSFRTHSAAGSGGHTGTGGKKRLAGAGQLILRERVFSLRHGRFAIPISCTGPRGARCRGMLTLSASAGRGRSIVCARASISIPAGRRSTLRPRVSGGCGALLRRARHHRLSGAARISSPSGQAALDRRVTLAG
ncbi:MAG: fibronectin type III domain-containing protein [Solirubrobacteraceae bacterium]